MGHEKVYKYHISDIAFTVGKSCNAVRIDVSRGKLDPADLASLSAYVQTHARKPHNGLYREG